jgi:hypothetical protein
MIKSIYLFLTILICLAFSTTIKAQDSNDHIFPPSAAAKPYINFDSKGFLINGKSHVHRISRVGVRPHPAPALARQVAAHQTSGF